MFSYGHIKDDKEVSKVSRRIDYLGPQFKLMKLQYINSTDARDDSSSEDLAIGALVNMGIGSLGPVLPKTTNCRLCEVGLHHRPDLTRTTGLNRKMRETPPTA